MRSKRAKPNTKGGRNGHSPRLHAAPRGVASDGLAYGDTLPFSVHQSCHLAIDPQGTGVLHKYDWSAAHCNVARAALSSGLKLAVDVPSGILAGALAAIGRAMTIPVCAGYDYDNERLILWGVRDPSDTEVDDLDRRRCTCK